MGIYIELNNFEVSKRLIFLKAEVKYRTPNYSKMVQELKDNYDMTYEKIAHILPISGASTVIEWTKGGVPNFEHGEAFIELWKTLTNKTDQNIPRVNHWSL